MAESLLFRSQMPSRKTTLAEWPFCLTASPGRLAALARFSELGFDHFASAKRPFCRSHILGRLEALLRFSGICFAFPPGWRVALFPW